MDDLPFVARLAASKPAESLLAALGVSLAVAVLAGTIALIGAYGAALEEIEDLPVGRQVTVSSAYRALGEGEAATPLANRAARDLRFELSDAEEVLAEVAELEVAYTARGTRFSTAAGAGFAFDGGPGGGPGEVVMALAAPGAPAAPGGGAAAPGAEGMPPLPPELEALRRAQAEESAGAEEALLERVPGMVVSPSFFAAAGLEVESGSFFDERDSAAGSRPVVLGARLARTLLAPPPGSPPADASWILGRRIRLNNLAYTVVGVAAPYPSDEGLAVSYDDMAFTPAQTLSFRAGGAQVRVAGMADELSFSARRGADLGDAVRALESAMEARYGEGSVKVTARVEELRKDAERRSRILGLLAMLAGASGLASAINVYNLMSGRVSRRSRDIATQRAVGASRGRVLRQTLLEASLVSGSGALLGAAASFPVAAALGRLTLAGANAPFRLDPRPDLAAAAAAAAVAAALVFALPPALGAGKASIVDALRDE